jgi:hypothetical protein
MEESRMMDRRQFCSTLGLATVASLRAAAAPPAPDARQAVTSTGGDGTTRPLHPPRKKFLFFDLWKLDYLDNAQLVQGQPEYVAEATYTDDCIAGKGAGKPSVFFDRTAGVWRMIYNIGWSPIRLMSAISDDGLVWRADPHPEIEVPQDAAGGKQAPHHVFTMPEAAAGGIYVDPLAEDGFPYKLFAQQSGQAAYQRALADPGDRWHEIAQAEGAKRYLHQELMLVSRDALHWQPRWDYHWSRADWHPEPPYFAFFNAHRGQHGMIVRPGWGDRRICLQYTRDFRMWTEPELLLQMDPLDSAPVGFYTMPVFAYDSMYVGLLWLFHNSSSQLVGSFNQFFGTMDAQLTYSYDGIHFVRGLRQPLLERNPFPEHGCTQLRPYSLVEADHEIRIYSGASRASHGRETSLQKTGVCAQAITLHRLRQDGLMYLCSQGDWARFQTKPLALWSPDITLNAAAPFGEVRYQVTDERSQAVAGFTFDDCVPLRGDDRLDWKLHWKDATPSDLLGKVLRLEFQFENARIYSLAADYHMLDALDHWLLQEGKQIDPHRFDY